MSDEFWRQLRQNTGGLLSEGDTDNGYQPWRTTGQHGQTPTKLMLVPARHVSPDRWRIPYFQTIIQRFNVETGQISLICPASGYIVFIEGRGLDELDELIDQRKAVSIHMFDEAIHHPIGNDAAIVTNIIVEEQKPF